MKTRRPEGPPCSSSSFPVHAELSRLLDAGGDDSDLQLYVIQAVCVRARVCACVRASACARARREGQQISF